jgi:hypothetical protein
MAESLNGLSNLNKNKADGPVSLTNDVIALLVSSPLPGKLAFAFLGQKGQLRCRVDHAEPFLIDRTNAGLVAGSGDPAGPPRTVGLLKCLRLR